MTNKQEQTSREAFEEFAIARGLCVDLDDDDMYLDLLTYRHWITWQAATQWADR